MVNDAELIAKCLKGDQQSFSELVRRYREPVFRLSVSILGEAFVPEAEEVAQEVFLKVHFALPSFRGDAQFSSWIYRITFNEALNLKRRVRYRAPHLSEEMLLERADARQHPVDKIESERQARALAECVAELPELYQSAVRLHYWMGTSLEEIANLLDVPENTVKSYLFRARKLLLEMLRKKGIHNV